MKSTQTTRAKELSLITPYRDPGINGPVRPDEVQSGLTGQSLLRTLCESFAWWTCNIRTQTLSEMCISLNCIGVPRQLSSRLMSRLKHQEKQFEDHTRQSPSGYVPTVLLCSHMSLGIFICRRRLVSISGNFILSCISVSTIPYLWHNGQHSCWICPDLRILCKKCNIALFISSLHRHGFSYGNLSGASVVKLLRPVEPHGIYVAERYGNYQNLWLMGLPRVSLRRYHSHV